jgi:hypothetical protein
MNNTNQGHMIQVTRGGLIVLIQFTFSNKENSIINIDYYMAFFMSYPLSALGHDISPRADRPKDDI